MRVNTTSRTTPMRAATTYGLATGQGPGKAPGPQAQEGPAPPESGDKPAAPEDQVQLKRFKDASHSLRRDTVWGAALVGSRIARALPYGNWVGPAAGLLGGTLAAVTGLGEVREGMATRDLGEVLDGAAHMAAGALIAAAGMTPFGASGIPIVSVGLTLLGTKAVLDRPREAAAGVASEIGAAFKDSVASVRFQFSEARKP